MDRTELILASASPRRADLLRGLGLSVRIVPSGASEEPLSGERPPDHAERLARSKALQVAMGLEGANAVVLGADTVVTLDGRIFGKPRDDADARTMLGLLSGREHEVLTAVHLVRADDRRSASLLGSTRVTFRRLDPNFVDWYVASGEPRDKAGAYSIQGLGVLLSERIEGSWSNVVGLPLEGLQDLLRQVGFDLLTHISRSA